MRRFLAAVAGVALVAGGAAAEPSALDRLLARTDAVAREVARIRGLTLRRRIPKEVVDRDELRRRLIEMASEDKTHRETAAEGLALARWGLIPLATDYKALLVELLADQIAGYYDPQTKRLTVSSSAGDDLAWAELVLAHEIDHGLQDQAFDLQKFEGLPGTEGDASAARRALVEGDGVALMVEVMLARSGSAAPWSDPAVAARIEQEMTAPVNGEGLDKAPLAIREMLIFPYRAGLSFVAALRRHRPWSAIDAAFRNPPRSTEQILHPERYLANEPPVPIAITPPRTIPGFGLEHSTVWGELGWSLFLRSHGVDDATAAIAAQGWGGDRVITLARADDRRPHRAIGIARTEWDSEIDAVEAAEAIEKALDRWIVGATLGAGARVTGGAAGGAAAAVPALGHRMRWMALDGTVSWLERRGASIVVVTGAPAWAADALAAEAWTASAIVKPGAGKPGAKQPGAKKPGAKRP